MKSSKATVEEHLEDKAFASLDDYTVRELEATSEAIGVGDTRCSTSPLPRRRQRA